MTAPPAPTIASFNVDGLSLALSEDASLAEFAAVVESDPALTAAVLRAANSAVSSPLSPLPPRPTRSCASGWRRRAASSSEPHSPDR